MLKGCVGLQFHIRLKALRKESKMTQETLAKKLGYGSSTISNYESGHNQPSINDLTKIAKEFDVSLDYLLGVVDVRTPAVHFADIETASIMETINSFDLLKKKEAILMLRWLSDRDAILSSLKPTKPTYLKAAQDKDDYTLE